MSQFLIPTGEELLKCHFLIFGVQSFVTEKLSQKLRHIRWLRNVRSGKRLSSTQDCQPKKRKTCSVPAEAHREFLTTSKLTFVLAFVVCVFVFLCCCVVLT